MSSQSKSNLPASIKQRLLNIARSDGVDYNLLLIRFAIERLLYRLSESRYSEHFYLKGAMLFVLWSQKMHRPTKDIDLLCLSDSDQGEIEEIFGRIVSVPVPDDGIEFDARSMQVTEIREGIIQGGTRVKLNAFLGGSRIPVQIDIGIGDAVFPEPEWDEFPSLLNLPTPRIRPYPIYTVVAEKFQTMVERQAQNSRMKDYFDILYLLRNFEFNGSDLMESIKQTFLVRKTLLPDKLPIALSETFWANSQKKAQWLAFHRKNGFVEVVDLETAVREIASFLMPLLLKDQMTHCKWLPSKGWV